MTFQRDVGTFFPLRILTHSAVVPPRLGVRRSLNLVLLLSMFWSSVPAWTQQKSVTAPASQPHHAGRRGTVDERVARLTKILQLNEAQQSSVKKILEQRRQEFWRIRHDPSLTGSERIDKVRALQETTVYQIRGVLNDEQKTKYDPLAVRRLEPEPGQRSVEDWLNGTARP